MEITKDKQYAAMIVGKIFELFHPENGEIDVKELNESGGMTDFIHALANLAPNYIYQEFTGSFTDNLEFNHLANRLVFQYGKIEEGEMTEERAREIAGIPMPEEGGDESQVQDN